MNVDDFKKDLQIVDSVRSQVLMLCGLYGTSGSGKTVTALIWAIGMVGPDALIGIVDTEQKRSTIAVDIVEKMAREHYGKAIPKIKVIHLAAPYNPLRYVAAIQMLVDAGCKAVIVDSMSHSWNGEGGYLEMKEEALQRMAGDDWKKREACAMAAAARVKPQTHAKLFNVVTHLPIPTILCFRGVEKTKMSKDANNKTEIKKDEYSTPVHEATLIFEMLISGECYPRDGIGGHCSFRGPGRKHTHPDILKLLPAEGEQFTFKHGEALAAWCRNASAVPATTPQTPPITTPATKKPDDDPRKASLRKLWELLTPVRGADKNWTGAEIWLNSQKIITDSQTVLGLTLEDLQIVIEKSEIALDPPT